MARVANQHPPKREPGEFSPNTSHRLEACSANIEESLYVY